MFCNQFLTIIDHSCLYLMFLNASSGVLNVSQSSSLLSGVTGEYNIWGLFENTHIAVLSSLCLNCLPVSYLRLNTAQTGRRLLYAASWSDAFQCLIPHYQSSSLITHLYLAWPLASHQGPQSAPLTTLHWFLQQLPALLRAQLMGATAGTDVSWPAILITLVCYIPHIPDMGTLTPPG